MKDNLVRAARTFAQAFLAVLIAQGGLTFSTSDLDVLKAAAIAGVAGVVSLVHNLLEDKVPSIDTR